MDLGVPDPEAEASHLPALEAAGYHLRPPARPPHGAHRGPGRPGAHLRRGQRLGAQAPALPRLAAPRRADRGAYAELERELATRDWPDLNAHAAAKGALITEITVRTEEWAHAVGWAPAS
jgi:hypothetical protein